MMRGDSRFWAVRRIALMIGLFGFLAMVGDQPWIASPQAKASAGSKPDLVAYFVSWHVTEHGSSSHFQYTGTAANPQMSYEERSHGMKLEMKGTAIQRYRADNGRYFDIRFLTVTLREQENSWTHDHNTYLGVSDCTRTTQDIIIDPGAYSGFHADPASTGVTWDLLGGLSEPRRQAQKRLVGSFAALNNMRFTNRDTSDEQGICHESKSYDHPEGSGGDVMYPGFPVFGRPNILEADSADRTSFSLHRQFTYIRSTGGFLGIADEKRYVTWTAHAYRMGKCAGHDAPIQANDPVIDHEKVDLDTDRPVVDPNTFPGANSNIANLKIRVTCEGVPVAKADVEITVEAQDQSGGHLHSDENRPRGTIDGKVVTKDSVPRTTDANGEVKIKYGSPLTGDADPAGYGSYNIGIAGTYKVTAKSKKFPEATATAAITARVDGLNDLPANPNYVASGATAAHPAGFHGTSQTLAEFANLANDFVQTQKFHNDDMHQQCPQKDPWAVITLSLNDIALPDGGIFDWKHLNWHASHLTHNKGEGGDFNKFNDLMTATAKECNGTTVRLRPWLLHTLMWEGKAYGKWDCFDLGYPPGCTQGEPPTSVGYIISHPTYPTNLHLHVQDATP